MATYYVTQSGNDTTGDGSVGNPYATPGKAAGVATTAGDIIYVKSGTAYTLSTGTVNVSGGKVKLSASVKMEGYATTAGDLAGRPVINAGSQSSLIVCDLTTNSIATARAGYTNIEVDGNSQSTVTGFGGFNTYAMYCWLCVARNCTNGFAANALSFIVNCSSISCTTGFTGAVNAGVILRCLAKGGTTGFYAAKDTIHCIADSCSGKGFDCYVSYPCMQIGCVAYNCGSHGFDAGSYAIGMMSDCIALNNGGYGYVCPVSGGRVLFTRNASYGNTSGRSLYIPDDRQPVTLTGDPFTNAAGGDFSLNGSVGLDMRGVTYTLLESSMTGYPDIGALQHADAVSGPALRQTILQNIGTY